MFTNFILGNLMFFMSITSTSTKSQRRIITSLKYSNNYFIDYIKPMILNGRPVTVGQIKSIVSIKTFVRKEGKQYYWKHLCGGSIINPLKVLTAAHCFEDNNFYYLKNLLRLRVVAGLLKTHVIHSADTPTLEGDVQWRRIAHIKIHSHYYYPENDIALVTMREEWQVTDNVDYAELVSKSEDNFEYCTSAGYGRVGYGVLDRLSPTLLWAQIDTINKNECSVMWEMNMDKYICSRTAWTDVGEGDSGGPLLCRNGEGNNVLAGIVCGTNFDLTSIFTRVSAYRDWILDLPRNISVNNIKHPPDKTSPHQSGMSLKSSITVFVNVFVLITVY